MKTYINYRIEIDTNKRANYGAHRITLENGENNNFNVCPLSMRYGNEPDAVARTLLDLAFFAIQEAHHEKHKNDFVYSPMTCAEFRELLEEVEALNESVFEVEEV